MIPKTFRGILLFWLLSIVALGAFWFLMIVPQEKQKQDTEQKITAQARELSFLDQYAQEDARASVLEKVEYLESQYTRFIFPEEDLVSLEFQLHELAGEYGLSDFSNRTLPVLLKKSFPNVTKIQERRFVIKFNADFVDTLKFVNYLERHTPVIFIDKLDFIIDYNRQDKANVDLELAVLFRPKDASQQ